jgi:hypothetical protein
MMKNSASPQNVLACSNSLGTTNFKLTSQASDAYIRKTATQTSMIGFTDQTPSIVIDNTALTNIFGSAGKDLSLLTNNGFIYIDHTPNSLVVNQRRMTYNSISH